MRPFQQKQVVYVLLGPLHEGLAERRGMHVRMLGLTPHAPPAPRGPIILPLATNVNLSQYLQQLAIITPYAQLELEYHNHANPKKDLTAVYRRRSEQMPSLAYEVKHHPGSVNNLLVQQLIHRQGTKQRIEPSIGTQFLRYFGCSPHMRADCRPAFSPNRLNGKLCTVSNVLLKYR